MHDQRLITRLQNYWDLVRRGKEMPEINQFNPAPIDDLWQRCIKLEVLPSQGGPVYAFKHVGEKLVPLLGSDMVGMIIDTNKQPYPYQIIIKQIKEVMLSKKIALDENQFITSGKLVKYRACFMPCGNDARGITHIIIGLSDKTF